MGRPTVLRALWAFIFFAVSVTSAYAGPAPYTDWAFDVRRANEKADLNRLSELTTESPGFARIYFMGKSLTSSLMGSVKMSRMPFGHA